MELRDQALSASDSFGSHFAIAGKKYGHIIDPKSGLPITERRRAVVLGSSAADTEALSKYVVLRGWNKGDQAKWDGTIKILRIVGSRQIRRSKGFPLNPK